MNPDIRPIRIYKKIKRILNLKCYIQYLVPNPIIVWTDFLIYINDYVVVITPIDNTLRNIDVVIFKYDLSLNLNLYTVIWMFSFRNYDKMVAKMVTIINNLKWPITFSFFILKIFIIILKTIIQIIVV